MQSSLEQYKIGFYTMNNKNRSNYIKYHEPTKLYPSNSGKININLNSYRHNTNIGNTYHNYIHKKKGNTNNFNINHNTKRNANSKTDNINLAQMLNNLKREIVEISNNIKETDSKVEYYMNKNLENSKKMRSNSANISKNIIVLPHNNCSLSNRGISLDVINSNYSKSSNFINNDAKKDLPTTDYKSSINTNTNSNNTRLTYNLYSNNNSNNSINRLTIQVNSNNNSIHKIGCLNTNFNKKKLYNNFINDIRPKYHTAENFYHRDKKRKQKENIYINKNRNNYNIDYTNDNNENNKSNTINSNKISEKSSICINTNYQDYINDSIKKIPKSSSSYRNRIGEKNMNKIMKNEPKNKIGKVNYKRGSLEKHILDLQDNITSTNNMMPGLFNNACNMKNELETLKNENEELKLKYNIINNNIKNDKKFLQNENKKK